MRVFYLGWWMRQYEFGRTHPLLLFLLKNCIFWLFFLGPLLSLPVFAVCFVLPYGISFRQFGSRTQLLMLVCGSVLFGALLPVYFNPHYVAPITCAIYALILIALRNVRRWKPRGKPAGVAIVRSVPLIAVLMLVLCAAGDSRQQGSAVGDLVLTDRCEFLSRRNHCSTFATTRTAPGDCALSSRPRARSRNGCSTPRILIARRLSGHATWAQIKTRN